MLEIISYGLIWLVLEFIISYNLQIN